MPQNVQQLTFNTEPITEWVDDTFTSDQIKAAGGVILQFMMDKKQGWIRQVRWTQGKPKSAPPPIVQ